MLHFKVAFGPDHNLQQLHALTSEFLVLLLVFVERNNKTAAIVFILTRAIQLKHVKCA